MRSLRSCSYRPRLSALVVLAALCVVNLGVSAQNHPSSGKKTMSGACSHDDSGLKLPAGETAALRSLANAARMLQDNPQLVQLRMLQAMGESSGNTLVVGLPAALPLTSGNRVEKSE